MSTKYSYQFERQVGCVVFKYKDSKKQRAFEYFLEQLVIWWKEKNPDKDFSQNNLGQLKIMMLLFFTSACTASDKKGEDGLLNIFNKFSAMPYGHIEVEIFDLIKYKKGRIGRFMIHQSKLEIIE